MDRESNGDIRLSGIHVFQIFRYIVGLLYAHQVLIPQGKCEIEGRLDLGLSKVQI
jgi:hypothetical protein